jgi:DNA polymerase-1
MVIGEAPGQREDDSGKPFVGRSGKLLDEILERNGLDREDVYITNAVSCRPPDNRTPTKKEIRTCKLWLDRQIKAVKPKFILLLGNVPLFSITGKSGIKKARGKPFEQDGIIFVPTYHPSYALRDPTQAYFIDHDIKLFSDIVNKGGIPREKELNFELVTTRRQFKEMLHDLHGQVSFDIETTCLYPWGEPVFKKNKATSKKEHVSTREAKISSIGFGTKRHQWILPFFHPESPWKRADLEEMVEEISDMLEDCSLIAQNGKFDFLWMWVHFGVKWFEHFEFDTMLAHYILDENQHHDLKGLAQYHCGAPNWDIDGDTKRGSGTLAKLALYQAHDLFYTRALKFIFAKKLREDGEVKRVFDKIMMPCARMFVEVEYDGVYIDTSKLADAEKYLHGELIAAKKEMRKFGELENWGSPQQLAQFLFGKKGTKLNDGKARALGIKPIEVTKTGKASTSESVILRLEHPIGPALLKYRGAKQQLSFFIEGWQPFLHKNKLHPSFKLHGTVTGRLSCEHPNLQQVPRDERIRSLIIAPPGWTLVEADLSQIELRIAAELAQERNMLEAFATGIDVHWMTVLRELERGGGKSKEIIGTAWEALKRKAAKERRNATPKKPSYAQAIDILLDIGPDEAIDIDKSWKELRKKAKAINFGYLYGMWWKKFKIYARDNYGVTISDEQAQDSRKFFFDMYRDYPKWHERQRRYARLNGYVRSLSGRKRRLPDAQGPDGFERQEAERQAINSPVQSFANELNLMSAIQLRREFGREIVRICGTVHDSILFCVKNDHVEQVVERLLEIMSHPAMLDEFGIEIGVPILAEAKVGPWGQGISFEKWRKENGATANRRSRERPRNRDQVRRRSAGHIVRLRQAA